MCQDRREEAQGDAGERTGDIHMSMAVAPNMASSIPPGWETRIYPGVEMAGVSLAARSTLASALGEVGVEAEYFLLLLESFPAPDQPAPEAAQRLYRSLEGWALRVVAVAASLEVATQGYLTELDALRPELRASSADDGGGEVWWPAFAGYAPAGEPLELRLRRCGQSYRSVVESRLPTIVEGIGEQMALLLHALRSMPPAGVAPMRALYEGLAELTLALQGDVVPRRIRDLSPTYPGLLTALAMLRAHAAAPASIEADLVWAREQLAELRGEQPGLGARLLSRFSRTRGGARLTEGARSEWESIVSSLLSVQRAANTR
jgi:hypothetical protein